jgi:hypothetical protein
MQNDEIKFEVLADGTLKLDFDRISPERHVSAEKLLKALQEMMGGPSEVKQKRGFTHAHTHEHDHQHG